MVAITAMVTETVTIYTAPVTQGMVTETMAIDRVVTKAKVAEKIIINIVVTEAIITETMAIDMVVVR